MSKATGRFVETIAGGETVRAFVPHALPAVLPVRIEEVGQVLSAAERELARLDGASQMVPSIEWFIYAFVRKEAIISSQIEGTEASLVDLLEYEAGVDAGQRSAESVEAVREVCNHVAALDYCRRELRRPKGIPISMRLLNQAHVRLLKGVRGGSKQRGAIRRSQNWIGGTRPGNAAFVPPPPNELADLLSLLERYIHAPDPDVHPLIRAAMVHVQFETIHPYLDGNGRIGRLLITLLLEHWKLSSAPLLYLSLYFKEHRQEYYQRLMGVRTDGDWAGWLRYFLEGVVSVAAEAVTAVRDLHAIAEKDRRALLRRAASLAALRLLEELPEHPIVTLGAVTKLLGTTKPTASKAIGILVSQGILHETTGRQRDRAFAYAAYLERLRIGTDSAPS